MNHESMSSPAALSPEVKDSSESLSDQAKSDMGRLVTDWLAHEKERAAGELDYWAGEYREIEQTFAKQKQDKQFTLKEYELWEQDAAEAFQKLKNIEPKLEFQTRYDRDNAERLAAVDGRDSIEAYAGNFYDQRNRALISAIKNSLDEHQTEDLETVESLHMLVAEYIHAVDDKELRRMDPQSYQNSRAYHHNAMIRGINQINRLADKYDAKRLIFRDFETNDFAYKEFLDQRGETNARAEYDRSSVEAYIRTAFSKDFAEAERGQGDQYYDQNRSIVAQFHSRD